MEFDRRKPTAVEHRNITACETCYWNKHDMNMKR